MFIVWHKDPVKGRGGGPLLLDDPALRAYGYARPWDGLRCEHHGTGRSEWTPLIVRAERRDGRVHETLVYRLPLIRSCCIADDFNRAAWWHDVEWAIKLWGEAGDPAQQEELAHHKAMILAGIRDVIRKPTPAGVARFAAFREERDAEDVARDAANRIYWHERVRLNQDQIHKEQALRPAECFAVLGLKTGATLDQVKARHRILAKLHHPDRGGVAAKFHQIQDAYEQAIALLERRAKGGT